MTLQLLGGEQVSLRGSVAGQNIKIVVETSLRKLEQWVEDHQYKGYEPFDGLSSSIRPLTCGNLFLDRLLMQLIRQSPINLRPLLGVKPQESTKGRGYMAGSYVTMYRLTRDDRYKSRAEICLDWLTKNKSPKFPQYCWGNCFDFASRWGRYSSHEPIIVWTALIGQAFLDGYEFLGGKEYLDVAVSICDWILSLPREATDTGSCLSYYAFEQSSVHNANMLGAAMLARTSKFVKNDEALRVAQEAMRYSCTRQLSNGAWSYAESPNAQWVDSFHTGYNLESLKCYRESTDDYTFDEHERKGLQFFKDNFFELNGRPKYYHNKTYPVDSQCAAQAIETLSLYADHDGESRKLACRVALWTIENMQDTDGHFYYRQYPLGIKAQTPMLHWAQATTYKGLTLLLSKL
jgi:polysaccharide biosynthesis protein VpsJ